MEDIPCHTHVKSVATCKCELARRRLTIRRIEQRCLSSGRIGITSRVEKGRKDARFTTQSCGVQGPTEKALKQAVHADISTSCEELWHMVVQTQEDRHKQGCQKSPIPLQGLIDSG